MVLNRTINVINIDQVSASPVFPAYPGHPGSLTGHPGSLTADLSTARLQAMSGTRRLKAKEIP